MQMKNKTVKKVVLELISCGASRKQALDYIRLIKQFEKQSKNQGEYHHILPRNCGWWKMHEKAKWNLARVEWRLHIALHAYLSYVFPKNTRLAAALIGSALRSRKDSGKKIKYKKQVILWRQQKKSARWIANKIGIKSPCSIHRWLRSWGISPFPPGTLSTSPKKELFKEKIINWYSREERSLLWISKQVGITPSVINTWLGSWGIDLRGHFDPRKQRLKKKIIALYKKGYSTIKIEDVLGVKSGTIWKWLRFWNIKMRTHSEANVARFVWKEKHGVSLHK